MEIEKILVPVDFSPCSINALKIAARLAKGLGASLHLINVIQVPPYPDPELIDAEDPPGSFYSKNTEDVDEQFERLKIEVPELTHIPYKTQKLVPPITDAIKNCIERVMAGLVIMGTKERHNKLEQLIGTSSGEVIMNSKVPVLVIPENIKSLEIKSIGFASDLRKMEDIRKLEFLKYIAKVFEAEIKIFHISDHKDSDRSAEIEEEKRKLLTFFADVKPTYAWMAEEEIMEGIFEFISNHKLDMLSMYPRHHGFWNRLFHPSITKKIVNHIQIPLLTFHE